MAIAAQKLTFEEYLAYHDGTDSRYELVDGELVSEYWIVDPLEEKITGCTLEHQFYDSTEFRSDICSNPLRFPTSI